jgi:hypothetical protein
MRGSINESATSRGLLIENIRKFLKQGIEATQEMCGYRSDVWSYSGYHWSYKSISRTRTRSYDSSDCTERYSSLLMRWIRVNRYGLLSWIRVT